MIKELTDEQKALLSVYRDKWLRIGLDTSRIDREQAKKDFLEFDRLILKRYNEPPLFLFMPSPLSAWLAVCLCGGLSQVRSQVGSQVEYQARSQVRSQVRSYVESQVSYQVGSQVWSQVRSQVWSQVRSQVRSQVWSQVESQVWYFVFPFIDGNLSAAYFAYYDYIWSVLRVKNPVAEKWEAYKNLTRYHLIYPLEKVVVFSEKPTAIRIKDGKLHADGRPAVEYADGLSVWALNGVRVPKKIAETPAGQLDPNLALTEKNADVQREIIRKIGYERVMKVAGAKTLHEWVSPKTGLKYTLKQMTIGEHINRKFLCYEHASMKGIYYAKPVPPEVNTCWQARCWQLSLAERDNIGGITEDLAVDMLPEQVK